MVAGKSVLAIIPARAGSIRAPLKNLTPFRVGGQSRPLVSWALAHASQSRYIDRTVLVSDSTTALELASPPVIALPEPPHLATAHTRMEAVLAFTLHTLPHHDLFVLLQPTSPLRTPADIDACLELAATTNLCVISTNPAGKRNGAVYACPSSTFLATLTLEPAQPYPMPLDRSLDIDHPADFV